VGIVHQSAGSVRLRQRRAKRLTSFNTERAASIDWQAPEHFWFKASDGRMIHNMIVKPANFDPNKKYPLFAVIHGGAANMWRDQFVMRWNYHLLAQPGYVVLLTDYKARPATARNSPAPSRAIRSKARPMKSTKRSMKPSKNTATSTAASWPPAAPATAATWPTGCKPPPRATRPSSRTRANGLIMQWGTSDSVWGREVNSGGPVWGDKPCGANKARSCKAAITPRAPASPRRS
jgi:hypothetical protein